MAPMATQTARPMMEKNSLIIYCDGGSKTLFQVLHEEIVVNLGEVSALRSAGRYIHVRDLPLVAHALQLLFRVRELGVLCRQAASGFRECYHDRFIGFHCSS
jgi:hypothetical protein